MWYGAPGADDRGRSPDEIRIITEMTNEEVDIFLQMNHIDTSAARELRGEPQHIALAVLARGPLRACVNPSGAMVSRIRDAKRGVLNGSMRHSPYGTVAQPLATLDANASEAEKFLAENRIDQAGAASFRSETRDVQQAVMAKGSLANSTNPSASLMARIRTVKTNPVAQVSSGIGVGIPAGSVPPAGLPGVGQPFPYQPSLAHQDTRPAGTAASDINVNVASEAMKAISKLSAQTIPAPGQLGHQGMASLAMAPQAVATNGCRDSGSITNSEDKRLQDEALKAIQALNAQ